MKINGKDVLVYAILVYFIRDILQQQYNSRFLIQRATFGCRMYYINKKHQKQLNLDLVVEGRYYQECIRLRKRMRTINKAKKGRFIKANGNASSIDLEQPAIQRILPALDLILTRPPDLCYSEFGSLSKIVRQLLVKLILTPTASLEFVKVYRSFLFPLDCLYNLSPLRYISSYSLTQYSRYLFITPILLRCQLRVKHIRPHFLAVLPIVIGRQIQAILGLLGGLSDPSILYVYIVTLCYARITRSNRLLIADSLDIRQRSTILTELKLSREMF